MRPPQREITGGWEQKRSSFVLSSPPFHTSLTSQKNNADIIPSVSILKNACAPIPSTGIQHVRNDRLLCGGSSFNRSYFKASPFKNVSEYTKPSVSTVH